MPISTKHNLCFIHIPKTAGTTIEKALGMDNNESFYNTKKYKNYGVPPQHLTYEELSKECDLTNCTTFSIVRNPFDRIVSEFHHFRKSKLTKDYHNLNFEDFVNTCLALDVEKRKFVFDGHLEPQVDFIRGNYSIKIFNYERLDDCFDWLRAVISEDVQFGHEKKSVRSAYKDYYENENVIRIVEDFYRSDLDSFDYIF